jgi:ribosomal protein S18 acetylase RimI-like enzyme
MSEPVEFCLNKAADAEIVDHLFRCEADFFPRLSGRVEISSYAQKIARKATKFEAWADGMLVGLVAAYCNDPERHMAYITSISVLREWMQKGIAHRLLSWCIKHVKEVGFDGIELEVNSENRPAIKLYEKNGFINTGTVSDNTLIMYLNTSKKV